MERRQTAIIIPAYNEEASIRRVVEGVKKFGQVIVADDASKDQTRNEAVSAGAIVLSNAQNCGYDGALNTGFAKAAELGVACAVTLDADGQHDPLLIPKYIDLLARHELVLGIRPQKARLAEEVMGLYFRLKYGIRDVLCGMKGYRMELYAANNGFDHVGSIGTELALASIVRGCTFTQVPVPISKRADKPRFGGTVKANARIFRALFRLIGHLADIDKVKPLGKGSVEPVCATKHVSQ